MFLYQALLLLGWLGITGAGGAALHAQQKVVYDQYFYFNSFETDADLEGWTCTGRSDNYSYSTDRKCKIYSGNDKYILSPEFDLRTLRQPMIAVDVEDENLQVFISVDGKKFNQQIICERKIKSQQRTYHYLIPVPDTVFRIKLVGSGFDAFSIYDRADDMPLSEKVFYCDFDRESDMQGWQHDGKWDDVSYNTPKVPCVRNFSYLITPELDLSEMHDPVLTCSASASDALGVFVSTDGAKYDTLVLNPDDYNYRLPRNTKRVKFQVMKEKDSYNSWASQICIREAYLVPYLDEPQPVELSWLMPEDNGGLKWEKKDNSFVLKGTALAGTRARLILPKTNQYYLNYAFSLKNVDPSKVKIEFNNTDISALTGEIVQKGSSYGFSYLKITSIDGSPVDVAVSDFRLLMTSSSSEQVGYIIQPEYWYDDIPNNDKIEFANIRYLYDIKGDVPYAYMCVENFMSFHNFNNDSIIDFQKGTFNLYNSVWVRKTDGTVYEQDNLGWDVLVADLNSDGRPDLVPNDEHGRTFIQLPDGTFKEHLMKIQSYEAYKNGGRNEEWNSGTGGFIVSDGIPGIRDDMFVRDGGGAPAFGKLGTMLTDIDFNHDGRVDLLNENTGQLLINLGDDNYVAMQLNGRIYFRDLNGDGKLDYVMYNETTKTVVAVVDDNGTIREQTLMSNLSMDTKIWCYDFDKDGDVDILLPFSYEKSIAASYLVMMENDGKGHFTQHESYLEEQLLFVDCADIDHDGYMDVVAQSGCRIYYSYDKSWSIEYTNPTNVYLMKNNGNLTFTKQNAVLTTFPVATPIMVADVNFDGVYEIVPKNGGINYLSDISANQPPVRPAAPAFVYEAATDYLKVSWSLGEDAESSPVDLTYALRIGTAPGRGDMLYAHAYADGRRRNLLDGNMGYNLDKVLDVSSWPEGKYYIALQAIDPMHSGSAWSEEAVFEKAGLSAKFLISTPKSTVDTMTVAYGGTINKAYTYRWDFDGAEVCRVSADSTMYTLRWAVPGEKTVSLQVSDGKGNSSPLESKTFDIFANQFVDEGITFDPSNATVYAWIDLDGNGAQDALTDKGVYENDGEAWFTKVKKIYNTNLKFDKGVKLVDITGDGMAEIAAYSYSYDGEYHGKANVYKNVGNMSLSTPSTMELEGLFISSNGPFAPRDGSFIDIDNDGKEDLYDYWSMYKNAGDYVNWENVMGFSLGYGNSQVYTVDFNSDGYVDVVVDRTNSSEGWINAPIIYENQGNGHFKEIILENPFGKNPLTIAGVADVNSDGYPDLIVVKNASTIVVCLNNRNQDFNQTIEINLPIEIGSGLKLGVIKDYDNNGYLDFMIQIENNAHFYNYGVVYFYPDGQWKYWHYGLYSSGYASNSDLIADLNGDGVPDFYTHSWNDGIDGFLNHTQVTNTPPEAPANIRAIQTDTTVLIEWDVAQDKESLPAQMRYNVSVKKKGATGDGAFIISPLNGLNDQAAIIPSHYYRPATRMEIPLSAMPVGDYEIQIQAFDGWDAHSPFSPVYDFSVQKAVNIKLPAVACLNTAVAVRYLGTEDPASLEWDWDGGTLERQADGAWMVAWDTEGNKKITVRTGDVTSSATILVKTAPDLNFDINAYALENSITPLTLPALALDPAYTLNWKIAKDGSEDLTPAEWKDTLTIARRGVTREVQVRFMKRGDYVLRLQTTAEGCGVVEASRRVEVKGSLPVPQIGLVTVDAATSKNKLRWSVPGNLPEYAESVNIYKEGSKYNDFRLLANVPLTQTEYTDLTSSPEVTSSRYRMTLVTDWGAEGEPGTAHRSVHMMINKGMGNSWNLIWTPYEGAIVESFRVLRGTSPDALEVLGEVAGSAMSWSDMTAPEGTLYYALEFDSEYDDTWTPMLRMARAATRASVRSNVVGVVDAADAVLAESLKIRCLEEKTVLNPEQKSLHLYADVLPLSATYRRVNWQIIEGAELATVDAQGVLTVKGNVGGQVKVCALAVDGSGASDTLVVTAERWELQISDIAVTDVIGCADSDNGELLITAKGGDGDVSYSINGGRDWYAKNHFTAIAGGDYDVMVRDEAGAEARWAAGPVHVGAPDAIIIDTVKLVPVDGNTDGLTRIQVTAQGGSGYQKYYNFDSYDNWGQSASTSLYPGTYNVRVKDENGCIAAYRHNPVVILAPGQLGITGVVSRNVSVTGGSDGEIHITSQGGVGELSYTVDGGVNYSTSPDFTDLPAGYYYVWVRDENGTMAEYGSNPVVITEPEAAGTVITEVMAGDIFGCYGDRTGEIWVTATTANNPLEYAVNGTWQDSSHFTGLAAGSYQVAVRDGLGNVVLYSGNPVIIRQPEELTVTVDTLFISDSRGQDLTISVSGSQGENKYSINNGQTWQNVSLFEGLFAGDYIVRVQDSKGCEAFANVTIHTPVAKGLEIVKIDVVDVSVYGGSDGVITVHAVGGIAPLQYSIDDRTTWTDSPVFSGLMAGTYNVIVRDAVGNLSYTGVILTQPDEKVYALEITDFRLQAGAATTASRMVTLEQHVVGGVPLYYQACEDTLMAGANWEPYRLLPVYELSAGAGMKTVYMRVMNTYGESHWAAASIRYEEAAGLRIEQLLVNDGAEYVSEPQIRLTLIVAGQAQEMKVELNGWESGWMTWQQLSAYDLTEGEGDYVCRVKVRNAQGESEEATVSFVYKQAPRKLSVEDFALQGGSSFTLSRIITLDHWVDGGIPVVYAASEYPDLRDARWLHYEEQPEYTLRGKTGMKTVYFAVASGKDTSEIVSARILLDEESASGLNVRVWPNPVNDVLHIMLTDEAAADETRVIVRTAMGQLVEQRTCHGREISLEVSRYPFGILFVELTNNGRKTVKQILKK